MPAAPTALLLRTEPSRRAAGRCQRALAPADAAWSCCAVVLPLRREASFPGLRRPHGKAGLALTPSEGAEKPCTGTTHRPVAQLEEPFERRRPARGVSPRGSASPRAGGKSSVWRPTCHAAPRPGPVRAF